MLTVGFVILGVIIGVSTLGERGLIWGVIVGYLIGRTIKLERGLTELRTTVQLLGDALRSQVKVAPSTDSTKAEEPVWPATPQTVQAPTTTDATFDDPSKAEDIVEPLASAAIPQTKPIQSSTPAVKAPPTTVAYSSPSDVPEDSVVIRLLKEYFTGGNTLVRVGIIILFIGMAFLAKYAADRGIVPIEFRMAGLGFTGLVLLVIGWRLRNKRGGYAMALQGGGVGVTYLTIFAAFRLYHLLPSGMAFGLMLGVCVLSAMLSVLMNARSLAILGFSFGFLAPILTSTGGGSHVMLFTYYTLLNFGIFGIAWFKSWRPLNLTGFVFTFAIGTMWGVTKYQPEFFASTEPFLAGFFLFYVAISVLYALNQSVNLKGYVDGTLVFGTPIIAFSLQTALVHNMEYGLAYSSLFLCVFYVFLAATLFKFSVKQNSQRSLRLLCESFLSIGVVFGTVAIPLALDDQWTAAAWALEGAALIYIAVRQQRDLAYFSGLLLQFGAAVFVLRTFDHVNHNNHWPVINGNYVNGLIMSVAGLISGYVSFRGYAKIKRYIKNTDQVMLFWGIGWWLFSGIYEIYQHTEHLHYIAWFLVFGTMTAVLAYALGARMAWPSLYRFNQSLVVFMILGIIGSMDSLRHPFAHETWLAWLGVFPVYYALLKRTDELPIIGFRIFLHGAGIWILTLLLTWESVWQVDHWLPSASVWSFATGMLVPCGAFLLLQSVSGKPTWPFDQHRIIYRGVVSFPFIIYMLASVIIGVVGHSGDPSPLPYLPIFNPLDLVSGIIILTVLSWWFGNRTIHERLLPNATPHQFFGLIAAILFLVINGALLKTIHHWYLVPLSIDAMIKSDLAQTSLTILWSVIAMCGMVIASKRHWRHVWLVGGALLAIVVVKLFIMDLANVGTVERIVSFIFVGGLMLVIGYVTPIPPKTKDASHA